MIEQAIYFALGCIITALSALLFAPVFWSRALRLTRKRLQLQVPLSMHEILAERDQLRARHAVEQVRLEQELARVHAGKDADMLAIGRGTIEAARLAEEIEAFRKLNEAQTREIELLRTAIGEHEVENAALLKDLMEAHNQVEQSRGRADEAAREHARLFEESEGHRTSAAALVARVAEYDAAQSTIRQLADDLDAARGERDEERERQKRFHLGNSLKAEKDRAAEKVATERLEKLEMENAALKRALDALEPRQTSGEGAGDADLRESIHALGLAVATMTRGKRDGEAGAAGPAASRRDEPE